MTPRSAKELEAEVDRLRRELASAKVDNEILAPPSAVSRASGRGSESFSFDQANRMSSATGIATYSYDGLGRRTGINAASGVNRVQVYDLARQFLYAVQAQGGVTQTTRYIYLGNSLIAETNSASGTTSWHTDALGSPVATSNASKTILTRTRYEAFGNIAAGTVPDGPGFTGHVNDSNTGLVYMQQR